MSKGAESTKISCAWISFIRTEIPRLSFSTELSLILRFIIIYFTLCLCSYFTYQIHTYTYEMGNKGLIVTGQKIFPIDYISISYFWKYLFNLHFLKK